jgi:Tol biopolymer transport system component
MVSPRVVAALAVALVSACVAQGATAKPSAFTPPRPSTLLTVPGPIVGFAQHGDHVVWGNGNARCGRIVELRRLSTRKSTFLDSPRGPTCAETEHGGMQHDMALSGTRALWAYVESSLSAAHFSVFAAAPRDSRERSVLGFSVEHDDPLSGPTQFAGGAPGLFVAAGAGLYRIDGGGAARFDGTQGVLDIAASGSRIATARRIPGGRTSHDRPAWSADGRRIAFISRGLVGAQLVVMDAGGSGARALANGVESFAWMPSGDEIAARFETADLGLVRVDGSGQRVLYRGPAYVTGEFATSPDSTLVAFGGTEPDGLYVVPAEGGAAARVGAVLGEGIAWSPDSRRIAYASRPADDLGGPLHVRIVLVTGGEARDLGVGHDPSWSPEGNEIAFGSGPQVHVASADGSGRRIVATLPDEVAVGPEWSADGAWLAFEHREDVWVVRADGSALRRVGRYGGYAWSPRSPELAVLDDDGFVTLVDPAGATRRLQTSRPSTPMNWSPDGTGIAFSVDDSDKGTAIAVVRTSGEPIFMTRPASERRRVVVEIRRRDGRRVGVFEAPWLLRGVAFGGSHLGLAVRKSPRRSFVEIRTTRGKLLRRVNVPRPAWNQISMSGRWIVYWSWPVDEDEPYTIRLLDAATGKQYVLARPSAPVVGLSIDGRRVAWAEQGSRQSRIRAVLLPRG